MGDGGRQFEFRLRHVAKLALVDIYSAEQWNDFVIDDISFVGAVAPPIIRNPLRGSSCSRIRWARFGRASLFAPEWGSRVKRAKGAAE